MKYVGNVQSQANAEIYATASGTLPNGKPVVVNSDGSVSVVDATSGGAAFGTAASAGFSGGWGLLVSSLSATKFVAFAQNDNGNSNYGTAIIGTVSGSSISFGTKVSTGVATYEDPQVVGLTETKFILVYKDSSGNQGKARVGTVSGTSISFGSVVVFESGQTNLNKNNAVTRLTDTKFLVSYTDTSDGSKAKSIVGTISGTSVSFGSAATFATPNSSQYATVSALSETKVIIAWSDTPSSSRGRAIVGTISGTSISYGSAVNYDTSSVIRHSIAALSDTKFVIAYQDGGNSSYYTAICGTVSGTSITLGTAVVFNAANSQNYWPVATKINENQCGITFGDSANSVHGALIIGTASGTSLSFGTKIIYTSSFSRPAGATLVGTTNFVIGHRVSNVYKAINYQLSSSNLTAENYVGITNGVVDYDEGPASVGSAVVFENANTSSISAAFDSNSNKVVIAYVDNGNSGHGTAIVGTVSGTSISFGSPTVFEASLNVAGTSTTFDSNANKVVISFSDAAAGNYGTAIVGTVSGTSISFGTPTVFESASTSQISSTFDSNLNKVVIAYRDNGNSVYGTAIVGTVSNTSISFGSATVFESAAVANPSAVFDSNSNKVVIAYGDAGNSDYGTAIVGTVSGTSISFGSAALFESAAVDNVAGTFDSNSNKVVILYRDNGNNSNGTAIVATVSGTSISFGTAVVFNVGNSYFFSAAFDSTTNQVVVTYTINSGALGTAIVGTVSGTSISFGSPSTYGNDASAVVFDSNSNKMVIAYGDAASPYVGKALVFDSSASVLTAENYVGMSGGPVKTSGSLPVVGSEATFESGAATKIVSTFDSNSNRVVIAYVDTGNSSYGTAVVGTVSGSSISFGTPVVFLSSGTDHTAITFDSNLNKIVVAAMDDGSSGHGKAFVGTVSNTAISFGSAVTYSTAYATSTGATFDSNSNKVVVAYNASSNGKARVGTVSGTSISFGTEVAFEAAASSYISPTFDSSANKVVIGYKDGGNSSYGTAIVGTISGTNISFGTAVVFNAAETQQVQTTFDTNANKVVIIYEDIGNSFYTTARVGTVSGTGISFGAEALVAGNTNNSYECICYDSTAQKVIVAFKGPTNTKNGVTVTGTVSGTSITFTTATEFLNAVANHIALAYDSNANKVVVAFNTSSVGKSVVTTPNTFTLLRGQVASGSSASVDIIGTVSTNQLSLTPGQSYFVQTDGTLALTAGTPSVFAGTAISATKLLVKT